MTKETTRRERVKIRQRKEIKDAALVLFSEKGFYNVSMHEIAVKADFAVGTLYKFFNNKENLYNALIIEESVRIQEALSKAIESPADEITILRQFVQAKGEVFCENAATARLYFLDQDIKNSMKGFLYRIAEIFETGIRAGRFQKIAEPYTLAVVLDNLCNAFLYLWLEHPEKHAYPKNSDVILNILLRE